MKGLAAATLLFVLAVPALAQAPEPAAHPPAKPAMRDRFFFGGGVGASFGAVDYVEIAPLIGFRVAPRFDVGLQPFYRWTKDTRYTPDVSTTDYGSRLFGRVRIVKNFFLEADYQYTNYEYADGYGGTTRASNNAFLAGAGYTMPFSRNAGMYFTALYDFSYDSNDPYSPYDSPVQLQFGVSVGF